MSPPEAIFAAVVFLVGVPAMWRNMTAVALVASWLVLQAAYLLTGESSSMLELIADYAVIITILCKPERDDDCPPYRNLWHQLSCLITRRSPADRVVMLAFPAMWVLYVANIDPFYRWWGLWWLALIQFLAAGYEGLAPIVAGAWSRLTHSEPPRVLRMGLAGNG